MPYCIILDFTNASAAQYDAVLVDMGLDSRPPAHALYHAAGCPDGRDWRVVDVWETMEDFERFAAEQLGPITAKHGIGAPRMASFPVHELSRHEPGPATFLHVVRLHGLDAEAFAALHARIGLEPPAGLVLHANGPLDGGWATVGAWTSKAARDSFVQERVLPAMTRPDGATMEDLDLHNTLSEDVVAASA